MFRIGETDNILVAIFRYFILLYICRPFGFVAQLNRASRLQIGKVLGNDLQSNNNLAS